jgi:hypothetical protein
MWRVKPQMGQVPTFVSGSTIRYEVQPFVLQYGRVAVDERRRMRRIATERPTTDAVVVRVIMIRCWFLLGSHDPQALSAPVAARRPVVLSAHRTARCREPERNDVFLTRGVNGGAGWARPAGRHDG